MNDLLSDFLLLPQTQQVTSNAIEKREFDSWYETQAAHITSDHSHETDKIQHR